MATNQETQRYNTWMNVEQDPYPGDIGQPPRPDLAGVTTDAEDGGENFLLYNPDHPVNDPAWLQIGYEATVHPQNWL